MKVQPSQYVAAVREQSGWSVVYYGAFNEDEEWVRAKAIERLDGPHLGLVIVPMGNGTPMDEPLGQAIIAYQDEHPEVCSDPSNGMEIHGPFVGDEHYTISVDGYLVPYVQMWKCAGENDGLWNVILDDRMSYYITDDALHQVAALLAHAMAVSAGFGAHGRAAENGHRNRHASRIFSVAGAH